MNSLKEDQNSEYVNIDKIKDELNSARKLFKENNWPTIDVTRKSVEETAASVIKIFEIKNKKNAWFNFGLKKQGQKRNIR